MRLRYLCMLLMLLKVAKNEISKIIPLFWNLFNDIPSDVFSSLLFIRFLSGFSNSQAAWNLSGMVSYLEHLSLHAAPPGQPWLQKESGTLSETWIKPNVRTFKTVQ